MNQKSGRDGASSGRVARHRSRQIQAWPRERPNQVNLGSLGINCLADEIDTTVPIKTPNLSRKWAFASTVDAGVDRVPGISKRPSFKTQRFRMTNSQRLAIIRSALTAWLKEHDSTAEPEFRESMLIRDGFFCGRRFAHDSINGVWFLEENELKISNSVTGTLIESVQGDAIDTLAATLATSDAAILPKRHAA